MNRTADVLLGIAVALALPAAALAQEPAKEINPAPLEHPARVTAIATTDPAALFARVRKAVKEAGFTRAQADRDRFAIDAKRNDPAPSKNYDRVLVWLERSPVKPLEQVDLYLLYGRYEEIIARRTDIYRVVVNDQFESNRIGALKDSLIAMSEDQ